MPSELFSDDDQAAMIPPDLWKIFGDNPVFTEDSILKSGFYIPNGKKDGKIVVNWIDKEEQKK